MTDPLVWLPFDPASLGAPIPGLRFEVFDPTVAVPSSVTDVEFYVALQASGSDPFDVISQMSSLRVIQTLAAGVDAVRDRVPPGVTLCNGRGIHDASTAELAVTLTLASLRDIPAHVRQQDEGIWAPDWRTSLADRRVMILGYGSIGHAIESRLLPFETEIVRVARTARDGVHGFDELPALLPTVDVVIVIVPLTDETRGMVDAGFLAALKDGALLVNVARGAVVDTDALLAELTSERLSAALDVVDPEPLPAGHPLWKAPNVLITPHVGGATSAMWPRAYRLIRAQLERFAAGEALANVMSGPY